MTPRLRTIVAAAVVVVGLALVIGFLLGRGSAGPTVHSPAGTPRPSVETPRPSATPTRSSTGLPICHNLPGEVEDTITAVRNNGPYLRPKVDGGTFGNRERLLPSARNGYYREYTVAAPRQNFPGPRRLVTGGQARLGAEPEVWFYTADHYESFCEMRVG